MTDTMIVLKLGLCNFYNNDFAFTLCICPNIGWICINLVSPKVFCSWSNKNCQATSPIIWGSIWYLMVELLLCSCPTKSHPIVPCDGLCIKVIRDEHVSNQSSINSLLIFNRRFNMYQKSFPNSFFVIDERLIILSSE